MPALTGTDVLAHALLTLQIANNVSSVIPVPFLSTILSSLTSLIEAVEKVRGNKERCSRLIQRVNGLAELIAKNISAGLASVDDQLKENLLELHSTLCNVRQDVLRLLRQSLLQRALRHASIAGELDDHIDTLDSSTRSFLIASSIAIRQKLEQQAPHDATGYRLFRIDDLGRLKARGDGKRTFKAPSELEGIWQGRAVVVKFVDKNSKDMEGMDTKALVSRYPKILHPSVAPILGYSHPSLPQQFYVLDLGDANAVPLFHFMGSAPGPSLLQHYLQMLVDYEDTLSYVNSMWAYDERTAHIQRSCHLHWHIGRCLPSAVLTEDGRIVIAIEDYLTATPTCLQRQLEALSRGPGRLEITGDQANEPAPLASAARALLPIFSGRGKPIDQHAIDDELARLTLWHCPLQRSTPNDHAVYDTIGSYGIMDDRDNFQRWGNMMDLFGIEENVDAWNGIIKREFKAYDGEKDTPVDFDVHGTEMLRHVVRFDTPRGRRMISAIEEAEDEGLRMFFRDHARDVRASARKKGIQVGALTAVCRRWQTADINWDLDWIPTKKSDDQSEDEDDSRVYLRKKSDPPVMAESKPAEIYFYQLPLLKDGRVPTPWGYWSLDPEPTPGPWPFFAVPGVYAMSTETTVGYAHQSVIEAELSAYLSQHRSSVGLATSPERFSELVQ